MSDGGTVNATGAGAPGTRDDSFREVYEDLVPRLRGFILAGTQDAEAAQDVLQEAMIRLWRSPFYTSSDTRTPEQLRRYAFRIAANLLKDRRKSLARYSRTIAAFEEDRSAPLKETHPEVPMDLQRAMGMLKERERTLLWLAHAENYTHAEIADLTGYSKLSVRVLLSRARGRLRKIFEARDSRKPSAGRPDGELI
ncbi:MAG: sigma-70 family RNA polymerase sigma factor [Rhodothermales bacterium]|nr:sigma-70 family RNA polymerase sigma factor [Rhodothermales bacterium]MBO6781469.1 sigma-70 family RNA polymerase sigma factor [Rhodothermales bacterium]